MVDLVSLYFIFHFLFISFYFLIFLFLEYRVRVKSQDTENEVEGSRTNDVIQHRYHMLTSCSTHGHCHMQVHLSGKLHPCGDATSEPYKPTFHGGHLPRNTSYGGAANLRVFRLPRRRYSYSTQSSMMELLLLVSQH